MSARLYAAALYGYIEHDFATHLQALSGLSCALARVPGFRGLLEHPALDRQARDGLMDAVFAQGVPEPVSRFFRLLQKRGKLRLLSLVVEELEIVYRRRHDIRSVEVTTAFELDNHEQWVVCERVTAALKQRIDTMFRVDARLIAGVSIRIGDTVLENSLRDRLAGLRRRVFDLKESMKENEPCR